MNEGGRSGFRTDNYTVRSASSERGSVFVELAIAIPIFLLFVIGIVDVGQVMLTYLRVSQVAYSTARLAAATASLELAAGAETWSCSSDSNFTPVPCAGHGTEFPATLTNQKVVHSRANVLMSLEPLRLDPTNKWAVTLKFDRANTTVNVSIVARYRPFFGFFPAAIPLRVNSAAPYLLQAT